MKIKGIQFKNHHILKNLKLNFENKNTVVLVGNNGTGKTTILDYIAQSLNENINVFHDLEYFKDLEEKTGIELIDISETELPKIIYLPAEIDFPKLNSSSEKYESNYKFLTKIDDSLISKIPQYITSRIFTEALENSSQPLAEIITKITTEINELFIDLNLDVKMIGVSKNGENLPLFKNNFGNEFNINNLSSGEKQLFMRIFTLKMLKIDNSIIMVDEPEISLHPKWQQKIVKVYEKIGKNNQLIITTHSPQILSSVKKENIYILSKNIETKNIEVTYPQNTTYGREITAVLREVMETDSRPEETTKLIESFYENIDDGSLEEARRNLEILKNIVGEYDDDFIKATISLELEETMEAN